MGGQCACRYLAGHAQLAAGVCRVGQADGIAVHGRDRKGRLGTLRDQGGGERAAIGPGLLDRHGLGRSERLEHAAAGRLQRDHVGVLSRVRLR